MVADTINSILGIPYVRGGRGPLTFDCMGVVLHVLGQCGVECPDPSIEISAFRRCWGEVSNPQPLDILWDGGLRHVLIVESSEWCVEALVGAGVVRTALEQGMKGRRIFRMRRAS